LPAGSGQRRKAKTSLNKVMLAVILVLVIGTVRLIGTNANNAFSSVASTLQ
jgi:hypothetical protein